MIAGEAGRKLNVHVEFAQTVGHEQLPLGFRSFGVFRATLDARRHQRAQAGLRRRLIVFYLAEGKLEPTRVICRDFRFRSDHLSHFVGLDDRPRSIFSAQHIVARILTERIAANAALFQLYASARHLIVIEIGSGIESITPRRGSPGGIGHVTMS